MDGLRIRRLYTEVFSEIDMDSITHAHGYVEYGLYEDNGGA